MCASQTIAKLVLGLLISLILAAHLTDCSSPNGSRLLRFVAQLSVSGCALFVHDTGAANGPHLSVEPLMCVTESLHGVLPRYDPVTQQTYVSVAVTLRDDAMLAEVKRELRHLSPKSVTFARVRDIRVRSEASSGIQAVGFVWDPEDSVGFLRLGCGSNRDERSAQNFIRRIFNGRQPVPAGIFSRASVLRRSGSPIACMTTFRLLFSNRSRASDAISRVIVSAALDASDADAPLLNYTIHLQNNILLDPQLHSKRYALMPTCDTLVVRTIRISNCTARVHRRLDMKGHFLIEPLLCHNITSMSSDSIYYDYSRDMYYLKLDIVMQDEVTLDAVRSQLSDLSPRSVQFMRLWAAQSSVSSELNGRFEIGGLTVSGDGRSGVVRVYCKKEEDCKTLRSNVYNKPMSFWKHITTNLTSLSPQNCLIECVHKYKNSGHKEMSSSEMPGAPSNLQFGGDNLFHMVQDGRIFVIIQQRLTGAVSFQRNWAEYEIGFGDETDFWIGLSTINALTINGATLRVEMKLWNGTELHAEYAGFQVGDSSTNYTMTYREMLRDKTNVRFNVMSHNNGMQFSTLDRDNDRWKGGSCSNGNNGRAGWWFHSCTLFNPNGVYGGGTAKSDLWVWRSGRSAAVRTVRMMLQI